MTEQNRDWAESSNPERVARLVLSYTQIRAEHDGGITNVQLASGHMVNQSTPVMALLLDNVDVIADFRKNACEMFTLMQPRWWLSAAA